MKKNTAFQDGKMMLTVKQIDSAKKKDRAYKLQDNDFDASKVVPRTNETRQIGISMTPAILK